MLDSDTGSLVDAHALTTSANAHTSHINDLRDLATACPITSP